MEKQQQQPQKDLAQARNGTPTDTSSRGTRKQAIREGDSFKTKCGHVYRVFDCMGFGRGYWVVDERDRSQTIFKRDELLGMERQ